ncbi:Histone H3.3B [Carabus blaptoides fortunei]
MSATTSNGSVKKPYRYRPGTISLREFRRCNRSVELVLPAIVIQRLVAEIIEDKKSVRFEAAAMSALHEGCEAIHLVLHAVFISYVIMSATTSNGSVKKPYRYRPGTISLREFRRCNRSVELVLPAIVIQRLVAEIIEDKKSVRFEAAAMSALHEGCEAYLIDLFYHSNLCTIHANREIMIPEDIQLSQQIQDGK